MTHEDMLKRLSAVRDWMDGANALSQAEAYDQLSEVLIAVLGATGDDLIAALIKTTDPDLWRYRGQLYRQRHGEGTGNDIVLEHLITREQVVVDPTTTSEELIQVTTTDPKE